MLPQLAPMHRISPSGLTWACTLSVLAHVGLLGWLCVESSKPHQVSARRPGTLQVSLRQLAPPWHSDTTEPTIARVSVIKPDRPAAATRPVTPPLAPKTAATPPAPEPPPAAEVRNEAATSSTQTIAPASALPQTPEPMVSGSPFRNLFAPLSARPFGGQASWRARPSTSAEPTPDMRQQQSLQMAQAQWQEALQRLQQTVSTQPIQAECMIQAQLNHRQISVQCQRTQDHQLVLAHLPAWPSVDERSPAETSAKALYCWHVSGHALTPINCAAKPSNENGSPQAAVDTMHR